MSKTPTTSTNDNNPQDERRSGVFMVPVNTVEDAVIEPVANRISWFSAVHGILDLIVPVELTSSWYKHIVYAKHDGQVLRSLFTQRFAAISTMASLLVSSQVAVMFSPSRPTERARTALEELQWTSIAFWAGFFLAISIIFSICSLLATLSAWALFNAVGIENTHVILRSSMCQNAAALPVRLAVISIYCFFIWLNLFWHVVANKWVALFFSIFCLLFVVYVTAMYSAVGRTIMYSGALGNENIMRENMGYSERMSAPELATALAEKAQLAKEGNIPVDMQYKIRYQEQLQMLEEGESLHLKDLLLPEFGGSTMQLSRGGNDVSTNTNSNEFKEE